MVLIVVVFAASCSGNSAAVTGSADNPAPDLSGLAQNSSQLNDVAKMKLQPVLLNRIRATGSEYQQDLVKDGSLTLEEYEQAELSYASCMQAAGYRLHPGSTALNGLDRIDVVVGPFSSFEAEQKDEATCKGKYTSTIDMAWAYLTQAIEQHVKSEAGKSMANCIKAAGLKPAPGWTSSGPTDAAQQAKFAACLDATASKYNIGDTFVPVPRSDSGG
jgi:hypothetical protein